MLRSGAVPSGIPPRPTLVFLLFVSVAAGSCAARTLTRGPARTTPRASALGPARRLRDRGGVSGRRGGGARGDVRVHRPRAGRRRPTAGRRHPARRRRERDLGDRGHRRVRLADAARGQEAPHHRRPHAAVDRVLRGPGRPGAGRRDRPDELRADRQPHREDGEAAPGPSRRPRDGRERARADRRGARGARSPMGAASTGSCTRSPSLPRTRSAATSCTRRGRASRPRSRPARSR